MRPTALRRVAAVVLLTLVPSAAFAAAARASYDAALAREHAVRARMAESAAVDPAALLKEIRAVENAYLIVVRQHPASSYCDDALWNAGRLALDAFARFGQTSDRETGIRLLRLLASNYPSSKFAKRVADEIAAVPAAPAVSATSDTRVPVAGAGAGTPAVESRPETERLTTGGSRSAAIVPPTRQATIRGVTRTVLPDVVRVTIDIDTEMPYHEERLDDPPRVFIDFPATRAAPAIVDKTIRFDGDADLVRQVRIGRHPSATTRVVLDAAGVTGYSVYALYNPYRLVIDCARPSASMIPAPAKVAAPAPTLARAGEPKFSAAPVVPPATPTAPRVPLLKPAVKPAPRTPEPLDALRLATTWGRTLPSASPRAAAALQAARAETEIIDAAPPTPAGPLAPPALLAPPARNSAGGFSMARQLGLGVSRIVIDPGHGGHDPGAKGKGVTEAELVLDIALRLERMLQQQPGVEVVLTRRTDEFIALQERTAIANREGADLFLSIHANASPNATARGIETYFLNFANNLSAAAVAARENAASGQSMGALPDFLKAIALNNKLDESRDFAGEVQHAMIQKLKGSNRTLKDLGVKQAPFVVLIGAAMPSVLAEISFVTNPQEAKLLRSNAYRQKIAEALFAAVRKYQASLHAVGKIAAQ